MTARTLARSAIAAALLLSGGSALAGTRFGVDVAVNGGLSTNPYGSAVNDTTSGTVSASVRPSLTLTAPTGATTISGNVTHTEYSRLYSGATDYSIGATTGHQLSGTTSVQGGVSYSSQFRSALYPIFDPVAGQPNQPNSPVIVDPGAAQSLGERISTLSGNVGLSFSLSPRDSLSVGAQAATVDYPGTSVYSRSYDSYGGNFTYLRSIDSRTSIGFGTNVSKVNYRKTMIGDSTQISPTANLRTMLSARITASLAAGVTFSDTELAGGSSRQTSFYGSANVCRKGERSSFCGDASRSVGAASVSGTSIVTAFGLSYSYALDARSDLAARISYSSARSIERLGRISTDYAQANVSYSRLLTQRLSATASATYSKSYNSLITNRDSFYGTVGINYKLGGFNE